MILFKKAEDLTSYILQQKKDKKKIGFVPTMGALHKGHLSLIESSKKGNDISVCSIFVNPTQFNNTQDFKLYPNTIEKDIDNLVSAGCDVLFLPPKEEIYPADYKPKNYALGNLETLLEGHYRPGHFQGVCQVVDRLLQIVQPDNLYLGAKDFQQCKVIEKLISLTGKENEISILIEPTLREDDGLAMSSRNLRLSSEQRKLAAEIFKTLSEIKNNSGQKSIGQLKADGQQHLTKKGFRVDYVEIADANTLLPANEKITSKVALVAAYIDSIRLIDNMQLT